MSESVRSLLRERAAVEPPEFDPAEIVIAAERRSSRSRRVVAVAAGAVVTAVTVGSVALAPRLADEPRPADRSPRFAPAELTWADGGVVHHGDEAFDTGLRAVTGLAVTDYGFLLVDPSGTVHVHDGSTAAEVGSLLSERHVDALSADPDSGLAAWVEEPEDRSSDIVVYDSRRDAVVARVPTGMRWSPLPSSEPLPEVVAVDGTSVYWTARGGRLDERWQRYDASTGEQHVVEVPPEAYLVDVADGVLVYQAFRDGNRIVVVHPAGARTAVRGMVVPEELSPDGTYLSGHRRRGIAVVDAATGRRVPLRAPQGYGLHQYMGWVDGDTLAVWDGDADAVLTCTASSGSCRVAVGDPGDRRWRPLFQGYLPG